MLDAQGHHLVCTFCVLATTEAAGVPVATLFVRNQHGSHNPHEAIRMEDFAAGRAVMTLWAGDAATSRADTYRYAAAIPLARKTV
jgi:hypothetical protein